MLFPFAGITRIRCKGMISARNIKAPRFRHSKITIFYQKLIS
jgi:hypothetical protein